MANSVPMERLAASVATRTRWRTACRRATFTSRTWRRSNARFFGLPNSPIGSFRVCRRFATGGTCACSADFQSAVSQVFNLPAPALLQTLPHFLAPSRPEAGDTAGHRPALRRLLSSAPPVKRQLNHALAEPLVIQSCRRGGLRQQTRLGHARQGIHF